MGDKATASSQSVLSNAATERARDVLSREAADAHALTGAGSGDDGVEPPPASEVAPLIRHNQRVGLLLAQAVEQKKLKAQSKDLLQIQELAQYGAFAFSGTTVCCLGEELLDMLEALLTSDEVQKQGKPLEILSLMREPSTWDFKRERPPNHGRMLPPDEYLTDWKGRTVKAMGVALDVSGFAGYRINLEHMGPPEGVALTEAHRKAIRERKAGVIKAVAGVLRHLPGGPGHRYTLGFPRPVGADMWRLFPPEFKETYELPDGYVYPEDTCHVFLLPDSSGEPVSPSKQSYSEDVKFIILKAARDAVVAALTEAGLHTAKAAQKPDPPSRGIVVLVPDGKDHLHITAHRASDDLSKKSSPKKKKKKK